MLKNVQGTVWLCSVHMLARLCSEPFKPGFSSTWTKNFQMYSLGLEKTEESVIKLSTFIGSLRKPGNSIKKKKKNICFIDYTKAFGCVDHNKLWKILKQMGIPDLLTCCLRNLYTCQEITVTTFHGTTDCFKQCCILSPCLFVLYAEYITHNAWLDESQAGIKIAGRKSNNLR